MWWVYWHDPYDTGEPAWFPGTVVEYEPVEFTSTMGRSYGTTALIRTGYAVPRGQWTGQPDIKRTWLAVTKRAHNCTNATPHAIKSLKRCT